MDRIAHIPGRENPGRSPAPGADAARGEDEASAAETAQLAYVRASLDDARRELAAARRQGALLEQALDAAAIGWWRTGPGRAKGIAFSPAARRIFRLGPAELDGGAEGLASLAHPDDAERVLVAFSIALAGGAPVQLEHRILRGGRAGGWVRQSVRVTREHGGASCLVGVCQDITAQKEAEANLEAFSYSVAHDLRAPLYGLSGFAEALVEEYGGVLDETGRGYAERIQAASQRMDLLIDDVLQMSRVSRAARDLNLEPVDLSAEAAGIAAELRAQDPGRQVQVTIQPGVLVTADRSLIRTVLQNLLENAWKFTARQADAVIEFGATAEGTAVRCFVRDNGAGFDPAYAAKLFQPFQRLHAMTDFPGTGVGLASVRQIIEKHGGQVRAEGAVGHGATFSFTLEGGSPC